MNETYIGVLLISLILLILAAYVWTSVWAYKKKKIMGLVINMVFFPIGTIIVYFLPADKEE